MVCVVVVAVAGAHLAEGVSPFARGAGAAGEDQRAEPGRGVVGQHPGGGGTGFGGGLGAALAAQGEMDGGEGQEGGGVTAVRFGEQPVAGPGGTAGAGGQDG